MATILKFRPGITAVVGVRESLAKKSAGSAELILFPGVRYERHDADQSRHEEQVPRRTAQRGRHEVIEFVD
jgi:hypothetical protein